MTLEPQVDMLRKELSDLSQRVAKLEAWRDNEVAKSANAPAWLFGAISAIVGLLMLLLNFYLASN